MHVERPAAPHFVDDTLKGQQDTVADLTARLAENPLLELVDEPADADVRVEVRSGRRRETGDARTLTMRTVRAGQPH